MFHYTSTITSKGQVTLPAPIRKVLKGKKVEFVLDGNSIYLRPIPDASGSLVNWAVEYVPLEEVREKVWGP